jgi:hypothetical protein
LTSRAAQCDKYESGFSAKTSDHRNPSRCTVWRRSSNEGNPTTALVLFGATNGPDPGRATAGVATTLEDFTVTGPAPIIDCSPEIVAPDEVVVIRQFVSVTGGGNQRRAAKFFRSR